MKYLYLLAAILFTSSHLFAQDKTAAAVKKEVEKIGVKKVTTINPSKESKPIVTSEPKKTTLKEKISAKPDPTLYRAPVKPTSEKIEKTDTKKKNK